MTDLRADTTTDDGFTLIEVMIVMVVLGILSGIVMFAISTLQDDAQTTRDDSNAHLCATARSASAAKYNGDDSHWALYLASGTSC